MFVSLFFWLAVFASLLFFHTHGFVPHDEGWFLQAGLRFLHGQIPYKDFDYLYNPGSLFLNALGFKLFGESILSSRLVALANSVLSAILLYFLGKSFKFTKFTTFFLILFYLSWGPSHINFVWPVMFCLTTGLASTLILKVADSSRHQEKLIFFVGALAATTSILKQNFGLAIVLADSLYFLLNQNFRNFKTFVIFSLGAAAIILIPFLYFLSTHSLVPYIREIISITLGKIVQEGALSSPLPWHYPAPLAYQLAKLLFYLSPLLIALHSLRQKFFYPSLLLIFYYLLSIRPTTDFVHLAPLLALSAVPLIQSRQKLLAMILLVLGFHTAVFGQFYRWDTPLINQSTFSANPRAQIWVDATAQNSIQEISSYFATNAPDQKYIFVYNFAPMFYFLLNKQNPTPFDYLHLGVITFQNEQTIISILRAK